MKVSVKHQYKDQIWYEVKEVSDEYKTEFNHRSKDHKSPPGRESSEGSRLPLQSITVIRRKDEI